MLCCSVWRKGSGPGCPHPAGAATADMDAESLTASTSACLRLYRPRPSSSGLSRGSASTGDCLTSNEERIEDHSPVYADPRDKPEDDGGRGRGDPSAVFDCLQFHPQKDAG